MRTVGWVTGADIYRVRQQTFFYLKTRFYLHLPLRPTKYRHEVLTKAYELA